MSNNFTRLPPWIEGPKSEHLFCYECDYQTEDMSKDWCPNCDESGRWEKLYCHDPEDELKEPELYDER